MPKVRARIVLVFGLALALALAPSRAEPSAPASASAPDSAPQRKPAASQVPAVPADEIIDLDFTDDFPARPGEKARAGIRAPGRKATARDAGEAKPAPVPARVEAAPEASRAWMYWTLGAAALAGVAGGSVWYLFADESRSAEPVRNRQVFTDAKE